MKTLCVFFFFLRILCVKFDTLQMTVENTDFWKEAKVKRD
jgi:hypothetical protein